MPVVQYSDEDHARYRAFHLVLMACRHAGQRILAQTMLLPAPRSLAEGDRASFRASRPEARALVDEVVIGGTIGPHIYAAGEFLGALSLLYSAEEVHVGPMVLARTVIEHCAHVIWILGTGRDTSEARIARALLDSLNGLEQAERYSRLFRGDGSPEHLAQRLRRDDLRDEARGLFAGPYFEKIDGRRRPALGGEYLPGHTDLVAAAVGLIRTSLDEDQVRGTYALLSTSVHATPNEIVGMTALRNESDPESLVLVRDRRTHEPLVRIVVSFFYSALSNAMSYSRLDSPDHAELGALISEYLPGHFGSGPEPGPFDGYEPAG